MENKSILIARPSASQARRNARKSGKKISERKAKNKEKAIEQELKRKTPPSPISERMVVLSEKGKEPMVDPKTIDLTVSDNLPSAKRARTSSTPGFQLLFENMTFREKENCIHLLMESISPQDGPAFSNFNASTLSEEAAFLGFMACQNMVMAARKQYETFVQNKRLSMEKIELAEKLEISETNYYRMLQVEKEKDEEIAELKETAKAAITERRAVEDKYKELVPRMMAKVDIIKNELLLSNSEVEKLKTELQCARDENAALRKRELKMTKLARKISDKQMALGYQEAKRKYYSSDAPRSPLSSSLDRDPFSLSDMSSDEEVTGPEAGNSEPKAAGGLVDITGPSEEVQAEAIIPEEKLVEDPTPPNTSAADQPPPL